jgi:hypothetical protein
VVPEDEPLDAATSPSGPKAKSSLVTLIWLLPLLILLPAATLLVLLRRKQTAPAQEQAATTADSIRFSCAGCGKQLKAKPALAGKSVRCPHCSQPITVPSAEIAQTASSPTTVDQAPRHLPGEKRRLTPWRVLGGLVLFSLVAGGCLVLWRHKPVRTPMVNVVVGCEFVPGIEESGLLPTHYDQKGRPYRWTNGDAKLSIPIDPRNPPPAVRVYVSPWRPPQVAPPSLRLLVNERELFHGQIGPDPWERVLDLSGIDLGNQVELQIVSDTFVPSELEGGGPDNRALGVQVRGVELLGAAEVMEWANRFLGCKHVPGVEEGGFYGQEYAQDGHPFRWTDGNARLVIPIARGRRLEALELELFPWRPAQAPPASIRIAVNDREHFNDRVPRQPWQMRLDLSGLQPAELLTLSIMSDTFSPGKFDGGPDRREHGVEVRSVKLIYHKDDVAK